RSDALCAALRAQAAKNQRFLAGCPACYRRRAVRIIAWPATDVGRVRSHNEDSHLVNPSLGRYLVADGMGGHAGGAHASQLCVDVVDKVVRRGLESICAVPPENLAAAIAELLGAAASEASARIYDQAAADH